MVRLYWLLAALVLAAALALLQSYALENYLYWRLWWFDIPMHILGGLAVGSFLIGFLIRFRPRLFLLGCLIIFVGWEVFEYLAGFPREANYAFDTALDLLDDTVGALVAYGIARITLWKRA